MVVLYLINNTTVYESYNTVNLYLNSIMNMMCKENDLNVLLVLVENLDTSFNHKRSFKAINNATNYVYRALQLSNSISYSLRKEIY